MPGPMKDKKGRPTREAAALARWKLNWMRHVRNPNKFFIYPKAPASQVSLYRYPKQRIGTGSASSLTAEKVQSYLTPLAKKEKATFCIDEISITPTRPPEDESVTKFKLFRSCFGKKETKHHGYLKWFALCFLESVIKQQIQIDFILEANAYLPNKEYWKHTILKSYSRILQKKEDVNLEHSYIHSGWIQEIDVAAIVRPPLIECGATSPMSLVLPLTTGLAPVVYWLPFSVPAGKEYRNAEWEDFSSPLKAFKITLAEK